MLQPALTKTVRAKASTRDESTACDEDKELSDHDKWLCNSPAILASVQQGLADSAAGRVRKRASYANHAEDVLED